MNTEHVSPYAACDRCHCGAVADFTADYSFAPGDLIRVACHRDGSFTVSGCAFCAPAAAQ